MMVMNSQRIAVYLKDFAEEAMSFVDCFVAEVAVLVVVEPARFGIGFDMRLTVWSALLDFDSFVHSAVNVSL